MRIIHLSYNVPKPNYTDPEAWLKRISFSIVVMESMTAYADIFGIYHINHKGTLIKNKVTYCFPGLNAWQLLLPVEFNRYVKKLKPNVVIVHGLIFPWQTIMLRWQLGRSVKIIAQHHAERPLKDIRQYLQQWADRYISAYLFSSVELGNRWVEKGQIRDSTKIKVIMGTSSTFYPVEKTVAKSHTGILTDKVFLWVGRLDDNKDPWLVARTFSKLVNAYPGISFYMIYKADPGEVALKKFLMDAGTLGRIHLVGEIVHEELLHWYNSADFIVSSSHYEGSGISVCEAMSCGCIPILTDIPSFRMMSDEGRIGLLYSPGDEKGLYDAVEKSLVLDQKSEREKVLRYFNATLSSDANARMIMDVVRE